MRDLTRQINDVTGGHVRDIEDWSVFALRPRAVLVCAARAGAGCGRDLNGLGRGGGRRVRYAQEGKRQRQGQGQRLGPT